MKRNKAVQDTQQLQNSQEGGLGEAIQSPARKKFPVWAWWVIGGVLVLALAVGGFFGYQKYQEYQEYIAMVDQTLNVDTFYTGIQVEGIDIGGKTMEEAKALLEEHEKSLLPDVKIKAVYDKKEYTVDNTYLSFDFTLEATLEEAYQYAREGDRDERYALVQELETQPKNFEVKTEFDANEKKVDDLVKKVEKELNCEVTEAHVKEFNPDSDPMFVYEEGSVGIKVKSEELKQSIIKALESEKLESQIKIPVTETQPKTTVEDVKRQTVKLSEYTTYSTNTENGTHNMALSLAATNGTVLKPGEIFSFNGTTGDTTTGALGYLPATGISNNKSVQVYGGGICQSSTTIYGAALRADMEIVTRYNHRWPSSYVPIGQDATVDYPSTDFQFKNSSDYPIYIKAYMDGRTLVVQIYGHPSDEWDTIEVESWQTGVISPPPTEYITDNSLPQGTKMLWNYACNGYTAEGVKVFYKNGQEVKREPIDSSYYMEGAMVYKIGPNTDPATAREVDESGNYIGGGDPPANTSSTTPPASSSTAPSSQPSSTAPSSQPSSTAPSSSGAASSKPSSAPSSSEGTSTGG